MSLDVETHARAHHHKTGHRWVDMAVAFAALFVSLVSLGVAVMHGRTMDRLVSANSWPFLSYSWGTHTSDAVPTTVMEIINAGVGPAKIESAELVWKGIAYRSDADFLRVCCGFNSAPPNGVRVSLVPHEVLRAGEKRTFLELAEQANPKVSASLEQALLSHDLSLNICYCSIFGECWKGDLAKLSLDSEPVRACAQPKVSFDQGLLSTHR